MLQNVYMTDKPKFKSRKGAALVISIFLAITGTIMVMTMFGMTQLNMNQITDNKSGSLAYYAAEAGLEDVRNYFNMNISDMGIALSGLNLPDESTPKILVNNSQYWVDSIIYQDSNTAAIVDIIGTSGNASRKIRVKLAEDLPSVMDDYGLLTDGSLTIHGDKILKMSIHGNDGLNLTGTDI
ncbi:MAG: hypothetical protein KAQ92_08130, partial [Candidatus Aenigmarchaeota archaeon]|nr:hypothetical protein [Candidatus Aenigmarchaeota archaeon]